MDILPENDWCLIYVIVIAANAKDLKGRIDFDNFLNQILDKKEPDSREKFSKRSFDREAQSPDQYLTDTDKKMINHLISNNLIAKLMNMYAISSRSRFGKRSVTEYKHQHNNKKFKNRISLKL
ncbi:hypothetical protein BpHYR1_053187 [Brachionus plicatilis]|uniref:Uncharacterized protein n=1 Tax=Brachionus plicatilis TaxID=10195 RepID=A0A3M7PQW6_BRAPC|nr:hypothetical protein BpHYR1_053187 [Brachionus plicatilis]